MVIVALVDWTGDRAADPRRDAGAARARLRSLGARQRRPARYIMTAHILPNVATPLIVAVTLTIGRVILFESVLSFLGFGIVAAHAKLGQHAEQRAGTGDHGARAGDLSRAADLHHGDRRQLPRRRPAARVRSALGTVIA